MKSLTASSVASALRCAFPFRPDVATTPRPSGPAALLGTSIHTGVELGVAGKPWGEPAGSDARRHAEQALAWIKAFGAPTHVERGFVYDARNDTAAWGPRRGEPGYGKTAHWALRGTLDLAWLANEQGFVCDLKSGKTQNAHPEQLYVQALAVSRITGLKRIKVGFLFSRLTKVIAPEWMELDEDMLDAFAGTLHRLIRTLPQADARLNDGCQYCEVAPADCPAFTEEKAA